jgi:hypothetical protein
LDTLTKGQPYSNEKVYFSLGLVFDGTWTEILLNLNQIQDYTMPNTWLHGFDVGMLQPSPLKEISPRDSEQWGDTKEVTYASLRGKKA